MKEIPETFKKSGITYRLVHKAATHPYCIYSAEMGLFTGGGFDKKPSIIAYELHKMQWNEQYVIMGKTVAESWTLASTAMFGKQAWSSPTLEGALEILKVREAHERARAETLAATTNKEQE